MVQSHMGGKGCHPGGSGQAGELGLCQPHGFNKVNGKVLHMGQGNSKHKPRLGGEWVASSPEEKGLEVLGDQKLNMTQQCALTAKKPNHPLGCTPSSVGRRARGGILPLCPALLRPPRESCVQLWNPQHRT